MIKKAPLIRALKEVASEYNSNSHRLSMNSCAMCKLYRNFYGYDCGECPMAKAFKACGRRQCAPVECKPDGRKKTSKEHLNNLEAVKEFYFKTIKRIQRMTVAQLNTNDAFGFMKAIDSKIAEKYGISKEIIPWEE